MIKLELIDTLWNVNYLKYRSCYHTVRINRYIMECKCGIPGRYVRGKNELIDTLWNVNINTLPMSISFL